MRRGFTLIELLTTMAIIAILAAVLLPVAARARRGACCATCVSNLSQIGLAVHMYAEDYDQRTPRIRILFPTTRGAPERSPDDPLSPLVALGPYIRDERIFVCPPRVHGVPTAGPYRLTYAFYGWDHCEAVYGWPEGGSPNPRLTQDMFETCNGQLIDAAASYKSRADGDTTKKYLARDSVRVQSTGITWPHGPGLNYLYVDGHVKLKIPRKPGAYVRYGF
ncbi:MAG: prepilin-type N-terminal cleavage/methylation domain-containing protein [Armatimonadetes bacterium]|nr:prepilin-type N-terminal cleavage/methylation domain-containing protein [Armatimonadota bacterium]